MKKTMMVSVFLLAAISTLADSAEEVWSKLVGPRGMKNQAYSYVDNNEKLPNIFIYGDSISIGFTPFVRKELVDKANVYRLYCNGGDSSSVIGKMDNMYKTMQDKNLDKPWNFKWDVIQFNVGLHDLKYMKDNKLDLSGEQVTSIADYIDNLEKIISYFKKTSPGAKLVFATTTAVPANSGGRKEGDAKKYNSAALEVLKKHPEVAVNDLYAFSFPHQKEWWAKPGNVHFTPEGCAAQGRKVAEFITALLKK